MHTPIAPEYLLPLLQHPGHTRLAQHIIPPALHLFSCQRTVVVCTGREDGDGVGLEGCHFVRHSGLAESVAAEASDLVVAQ